MWTRDYNSVSPYREIAIANHASRRDNGHDDKRSSGRRARTSLARVGGAFLCQLSQLWFAGVHQYRPRVASSSAGDDPPDSYSHHAPAGPEGVVAKTRLYGAWRRD